MTSISQDATHVANLKANYERAKKEADDAERAFKEAQMALYERMEHEDIGSLKVGNINFVRAETAYGTVQDRAAFVKWALEERPELVEHRERAALINELVRESLNDGTPLPPGLGFYVRQYVSQRSA
jgi:hypothetical protein